MKKFIIILLTLPLIATSCLKDDEDKFDKSASERMKEYLDNTSKVLSAAPNGWVVDYYPDLQYGGIRMYMKFDATTNTVVIASEAGAADAIEKSYYSFGEDYGPTLNFDTENTLLHYYSKPYGVVGEENTGWGGDYEFIIMSVDPNKVVLRGKKTQNDIVLTPATEANWAPEFTAFRKAAEKMDEMRSYQLVVGSRSYQISREIATKSGVNVYRTRHFTINCTPAVSVGYIYTATGIKFYEPITIDNVTISEMTWQNGGFVDEKTGSKITEIETDYTFDVKTSDIQIRSAKITVKPSNSNVYYVIGTYAAADIQGKSEAKIMNDIIWKTTVEDLYQKESVVTPKLKAETEYIACAFAVTIINGFVYPTSALAKSEPFTTLPDVPMEPGYEAWLGTWTVVSTSSEISKAPLTFNITIAENDRNRSVYIYGWSIVTLRDLTECYGIGTYTNGNLKFENEQYILSPEKGWGLYWCSRFVAADGYSGFLSGTNFTPFILTMNADKKSAKAVGESGFSVGTHKDCVISSMDYCQFDDEGLYVRSYYAADGYKDNDYPIGPYTMTKTGNKASVAPVMARKSSNNQTFLVNMKTYSKPVNNRVK